MRILPSLLSLALASTVVTGCTTKKYYTTTGTDGGTNTGGTPSVSGASPASAFLGRTLDVTLSGSETNWSSTTTVSFGDKITVNKLTVASASALVANITVDPAAAIGPRDVTVTDGASSEPFKMAFSVNEAATVSVVGDAKQGSLLLLTIKNNDLSHLFDATSEPIDPTNPFSAVFYPNINLTTPAGVTVNVNSVTQFEIDAQINIDTTAAAGPIDFDIQSGPAGGTVDHFYYPAAITIAAQTPTALTNNATFTIANVLGSQLFSFTPTINHQYTFNGIATGNGDVILAILDKTGTWAGEIGDLTSPLTYFATTADPIYVIALDDSGNTANADSISIGDVGPFNVTTATTGHTTKATADAVTLPALVQNAQLTSQTDTEWYKLTAAATGTLTAATAAGDPQADTIVTVYAADGTTVIAQSDDSAYLDSVTAAVTTGTVYYVVVTYSDQSAYDASESHYNLELSIQ